LQDFRKLKVWMKAHGLTLEIYRSTERFPSRERYGLTSQLRRGAVSVASNIAEGCGRGTPADFGRLLQMSLGSASEIEYQVTLARDLGYLDQRSFQSLDAKIVEVKRMLTSLRQRAAQTDNYLCVPHELLTTIRAK